MEIGLEEQLATDFDWFCVDAAGQIGHFTTAGFKELPKSVASSAEELDLVTRYIAKLPSRGSHRLSKALQQEIPAPGDRAERYLQSFIAMADKGLYSFDIASYLRPNAYYFKVASPERPLFLSELPRSIRAIVARTELRDRRFQAIVRVAYEDTVAL